jgi:putative ABC transport system ATP-binding protein
MEIWNCGGVAAMEPALLVFKDLSRQIDEDGRRIVASGQVEPGQALFVKGSSGSGKSTLLRILGRILSAQSGEVWLEGRPWMTITAPQWRLLVQYLPQKPIVFDGTVQENLLLPFRFKLMERKGIPSPSQIEGYLKKLKLPNGILTQSAKTLSGGEAARIALIRALLLEPQVLLLDEPTAYLDEDNRSHLLALLKEWMAEKPRAIIMVSHNEQDLLAFTRRHSLQI